MNWDALGAVGEIVGALAVLGTLIYLARQINQNTRSMQASSYQSLIGQLAAGNDLLASDAELSRIYHLGIENLSALTTEESRRFHHLCNSMTRRIENIHLQATRGLLHDEDWDGIRESAFHVLEKPGFQTWWRAHTYRFNKNFVNFVDAELHRRDSNLGTPAPDD